MYKYNGRIIRVGRGWKDDNNNVHPRNWANWTLDAKTAVGLVWEDDPAPFDSRFYWSADVPKSLDDVNEVDENGDPLLDDNGDQVVTKGLKSNAIAAVKAQAGGLLQDTDWMVIKAAEVADYSVPDAILTYRADVRAASNTIEAAITAAADLDAFMALYDAPVDADGNQTGNAPIVDFPEA